MISDADIKQVLRQHGIQPSVQRVAIAGQVLWTDRHPTADQVLKDVQLRLPVVSRATVYNTLRLFVEKGLLRQYQIAEGPTVYDPNVDRHHHLIDAETGRVIDIPWDAVEVKNVEGLEGFEVDSYMVVLRGRKRDDS